MPIDPELIGAAGPAVEPGDNTFDYGAADLSPQGAFRVRSLQSFTLTYRVGALGLDDTGAIRLAFRVVSDQGALQTNNPAGIGYVTAEASNGSTIDLDYQSNGGVRPFSKTLTARLQGVYLKPNDTITIRLGDPRFGSPGMLLQTFAETGCLFQVSTDLCATGHFLPLKHSPSIDIIPDVPVRWVAVLPSFRRPGESFSLGIKAEDRWGNPTAVGPKNLAIKTASKITGLPAKTNLPAGQRALRLAGLTLSQVDTHWVQIFDNEAPGKPLLATAGPLVIGNADHAEFWGDMHGQSGETVGIGSALDYFSFARDLAFLDACAHQGNDFQINQKFWRHLNEITAEFNQDGAFATVPGYEWSGNTAVGGDHNVYYRDENRPVYRSSHALMLDRSELANDARDTNALYAALRHEDAVVAAHVGGRYADINFAHDPELEPAVEIHSDWGTFEWIMHDAFDAGYRVGVVANSDGHKGRPGASYPGAATFGAYGGLTCFKLPELSRDAILNAWRNRKHFATTGCRAHLATTLKAKGLAKFATDPAINPKAKAKSTPIASMGDMVTCQARKTRFEVDVAAPSGVDLIEFRNGKHVIKRVRPYTAGELGGRFRILCAGAAYRGRGRQVLWRARAQFSGARIKSITPVNWFNPERPIDQISDDTIVWQAVTTGNAVGFDVQLEFDAGATLRIDSNYGTLTTELATLGIVGKTLAAGGLERRIEITRKPDENRHFSMSAQVDAELMPVIDNPLWVAITLDNGHQLWSSPIYVIDPRQN